MMKIVSNCPLCEEHSLHVIEEDGIGTQQCISCGYATSDKFIGSRNDNEVYKTLPGEMQSWSKEANGNFWIPSMITLPFGTLYPTNINDKMKWACAEMVDIPEEEQKNYPDGTGGFYKQRYDTDNAKIFDEFYMCLYSLNKEQNQKNDKIQS